MIFSLSSWIQELLDILNRHFFLLFPQTTFELWRQTIWAFRLLLMLFFLCALRQSPLSTSRKTISLHFFFDCSSFFFSALFFKLHNMPIDSGKVVAEKTAMIFGCSRYLCNKRGIMSIHIKIKAQTKTKCRFFLNTSTHAAKRPHDY